MVHEFLQLLMKTSARQTAKTATPLEQLRQALERVSYLLKDLFLIAMCFYSMVVCLSKHTKSTIGANNYHLVVIYIHAVHASLNPPKPSVCSTNLLANKTLIV